MIISIKNSNHHRVKVMFEDGTPWGLSFEQATSLMKFDKFVGPMANFWQDTETIREAMYALHGISDSKLEEWFRKELIEFEEAGTFDEMLDVIGCLVLMRSQRMGLPYSISGDDKFERWSYQTYQMAWKMFRVTDIEEYDKWCAKQEKRGRYTLDWSVFNSLAREANLYMQDKICEAGYASFFRNKPSPVGIDLYSTRYSYRPKKVLPSNFRDN